jgi:hypothetical protein
MRPLIRVDAVEGSNAWPSSSTGATTIDLPPRGATPDDLLPVEADRDRRGRRATTRSHPDRRWS